MEPVCVCGHKVFDHGGDQDEPWPCLICECEDFEENLTEALFEMEEE